MERHNSTNEFSALQNSQQIVNFNFKTPKTSSIIEQIQQERKQFTNDNGKKLEKNLKRINWSLRNDEVLLTIIMKNMIRFPFLEHNWLTLKEKNSLKKISLCMMKSKKNILKRINKLQNVHAKKYQDQDFVQFIITYSEKKSFSCKIVENTLLQLKRKCKQTSPHIQLVNQMLQNQPLIQQNIDTLFKLIMDGQC